MSDFFAMGGYGAYVWAAFGTMAAVVVLNLIAARRRSRIIRDRLRVRLARRTGRKSPR